MLSAIVLLGLIVAPTRAVATVNDADFARKLVEVFNDCQKVKPGMTRAELITLQMFDEDRGPLHARDDHSFKQHLMFEYRSCSLIKVNIDFGASDSPEERPIDVITKVSLPYIDARSRR